MTKSKNSRKPWTSSEFRAIQIMAQRLRDNDVNTVYRAVRELQADHMPDRSWDAIRSKLFEARCDLAARINNGPTEPF